MREFTSIEKRPAYGPSEAARYLRLSANKVSRWAKALCMNEVIDPFPISFVHLLELHVLKAMRIRHDLPMQRIHRAIEELRQRYGDEFPLLAHDFLTDGLNVLIEEHDAMLNLSRSSQRAFRQVVGVYLQRIEIDPGMAKLYPFVYSDTADEPKSILISADVSFGRPVVAGTGISTEVIAARFDARESVDELADEYGLSRANIEEAIRWERHSADAA